MTTYRSPGVYIEEIPTLPPSIAEVESAVPAFIGYTQKATNLAPSDLLNVPMPINSLSEYEFYFGSSFTEDPASIDITVDETQDSNGKTTGYTVTIVPDPTKSSPYNLHDAMELYFDNGGTQCYIVSVGLQAAEGTIDESALKAGLDAVGGIAGPTILLSPEAVNIADAGQFNSFNQAMIEQAATLKDRFAIIDTKQTTVKNKSTVTITTDVNTAIGAIPADPLVSQFGAVYYPWLETSYNYNFTFDNVTITAYTINTKAPVSPAPDLKGKTMSALKTSIFPLYNAILTQFNKYHIVLPPSAAIAGIYCNVDRTRGVWKAPANVSINDVTKALITISRTDQDQLNVNDTTGRSVNAILNSPGFGTVVMGARTLDGNDNEWRYISVRRFFIMVEQSVKNSTGIFVFEPNTAPTWVKVQAMIENYLFQKWRDGALAGAKPEQAYFVNVGLGTTMTAQDILEGRLIVQVGMAVARPAEFIVMQFEQMMQTS